MVYQGQQYATIGHSLVALVEAICRRVQCRLTISELLYLGQWKIYVKIFWGKKCQVKIGSVVSKVKLTE